MPAIEPVINSISANAASLFSDQGDGRAFEKALDQAAAKGRETVSKALERKGVTSRSGRDTPFTFKRGHQSPEVVRKAMDLTKASLPSGFRKKIGLGLMARGQEGSSVNSMEAGAGLMDCATSGQALKEIFASLGGERLFLKLDKKALPALAQVLSDSGLDEEAVNVFLKDAAQKGLGLDQLFYNLSKLSLEDQKGGGLKATEDGLTALGQFFGSLGASAEIVSQITSGFVPGEDVTAAALRNIIGSGDDGFLAPGLTEADAYNLAAMLRSMGAGSRQLNSLSNLLAESRGHLSINDFLNFIENMEKAPAQTIGSGELDQIQAILANISREQGLVKTPVFDEILTKIQMLGDREIDDSFIKLSPALQALRGGLTGQAQNAAFGGQSGHQQGQGGPRDGREEKEQYRHLMNASLNGAETSQAAAVEATETMQGYGGQESLARQISQKMIYSHRRGLNRLKMKLAPENLGRLDIELRVKDDQLVAHIRADSREAYQALASEIESLKEALAKGGLEIAGLTVAFDDGLGGELQFADLDSFNGPGRTASPDDGDLVQPGQQAADGAVHRVV